MTAAGQPAHRILVTGASGFIGRALIETLTHSGHTVLAVSRTPAARPGIACATVTDYQDTAQLMRLAQGYDTVIHLAALAHYVPSRDECAGASPFLSNVTGTSTMAHASAAAGVRRFILLSSIGVNGNHTEGRPFTETSVPHPAEPYAVSKLQCETALQEVIKKHPAMDFVIIRPPLVYGPQAPGNFGKMLGAIARRTPLPLGQIPNQRSFVGLDNLLSLIELCVRHPEAANQTYLVCDGEDVSTTDFIRRIGLALETPARLLKIPPSLIRLAGWLTGRSGQVERLLSSLQVDSSKARTQLGWTPVLTLDQGLRRAAAGSMPGRPDR